MYTSLVQSHNSFRFSVQGEALLIQDLPLIPLVRFWISTNKKEKWKDGFDTI